MWVFMAVAAAEGGPGCDKEARRVTNYSERIAFSGGAQTDSRLSFEFGRSHRRFVRGQRHGPGGPS